MPRKRLLRLNKDVSEARVIKREKLVKLGNQPIITLELRTPLTPV